MPIILLLPLHFSNTDVLNLWSLSRKWQQVNESGKEKKILTPQKKKKREKPKHYEETINSQGPHCCLLSYLHQQVNGTIHACRLRRGIYTKLNGSHFGLPPNSIHQMTGLGGNFVNYESETMKAVYRPFFHNVPLQKKVARNFFLMRTSWGTHESSWGTHETSWVLMRAHEDFEILMSSFHEEFCSWLFSDCSWVLRNAHESWRIARVLVSFEGLLMSSHDLPFLTEKSWSRAMHLKIGVTVVPMTTCHKHGKNMNAVWPGFVANVAGRHFLHRFEFRALATELCQFVLCLGRLQFFTLQFVFDLLELSTLTFQDSFMLSRKRSFSVYLRSLD